MVHSKHFISIRKTRMTRMIKIARVTEVTKMTLMNRVNLGTRMSWFKDDKGDFINKVDCDECDI